VEILQEELTVTVKMQVIDEYQKAFGESWRTVQEDSTQPWPYLNEALTKFQACKRSFYFLFIFFFSVRLLHFANLYTELLMPQPPFYLFLSNHQDPAEADKLLKIQRELDETKIILVSIHCFIFFPNSILIPCVFCFPMLLEIFCHVVFYFKHDIYMFVIFV